VDKQGIQLKSPKCEFLGQSDFRFKDMFLGNSLVPLNFLGEKFQSLVMYQLNLLFGTKFMYSGGFWSTVSIPIIEKPVGHCCLNLSSVRLLVEQARNAE